VKIKWKMLRTDLSPGDLREALLEFCSAEMKIAPIGSITELTIPQLNRILAAIDREMAQPRLPGQAAVPRAATSNGGAEVTNLASEEQRWIIEQLFDMAGWHELSIERFLSRGGNARRRQCSPRDRLSSVYQPSSISSREPISGAAAPTIRSR